MQHDYLIIRIHSSVNQFRDFSFYFLGRGHVTGTGISCRYLNNLKKIGISQRYNVVVYI